MNDESIRSPLKKLHSALKGATSTTVEDRELLKQLLSEWQYINASITRIAAAKHS